MVLATAAAAVRRSGYAAKGKLLLSTTVAVTETVRSDSSTRVGMLSLRSTARPGHIRQGLQHSAFANNRCKRAPSQLEYRRRTAPARISRLPPWCRLGADSPVPTKELNKQPPKITV